MVPLSGAPAVEAVQGVGGFGGGEGGFVQPNQARGEVFQGPAEEEEGEEVQVDGVRVVLENRLEGGWLDELVAVQE